MSRLLGVAPGNSIHPPETIDDDEKVLLRSFLERQPVQQLRYQ